MRSPRILPTVKLAHGLAQALRRDPEARATAIAASTFMTP